MIDYHIDVARRIVTTRVSGRISFGDFANHLQRILRDPKFSPELNALIVAVDAAAIPSEPTLALIKPLLRAWSVQRAGAKWAFVLPDAQARAFADGALLELRLTSVTTRTFLTESSALAWLETVPAALPPA